MATLRDAQFTLELRLLRADPAEQGALAGLLADDLVEFGQGGRVYGRAEVLAVLAGAAPRDLALERFEVRELAPGCALATSVARGVGQTSLHSSVWILRDGTWRLVFHQGTRVPEDG